MTSIDILGAQASVRTYDVLTTGMVGATVEFRFDKSWDNLVRTAVFRQGAVTKDVVNIGTTAKIPPEVLMIPGLSVKIGVLGTNSDGTVVIPTVWAETRPVKDGTDPSGDESADPTLPVWEQILATIGDMHSLSTEAKGNLVASINELVQLCEDGTVDAEYIQQEVEKYLKENPVTETDPTVPAWAKQPEKPKYTAQEVGALPADTVIPTVPDNVSAFQNDAGYLTKHQDISGKLDRTELPEAVNTALAQAKASGEFDGPAGPKGDTGETGPQGPKGDTGAPGKDGVPATHKWSGTTLTITSASGTSSADLKGDKGDKGDTGPQGAPGEKGETGAKGDKGDKGDQGEQGVKGDKGDTGSAGKDGTSVTVKSVSESTADGGSNVVTFSDGKTVTIKNGSKGRDGKDGLDATPVTPLFANSIEECTDTAKLYVLPDGYIYAYMKSDGYTNQVPISIDKDGTVFNGVGYQDNSRLVYTTSGDTTEALASHVATGYIPMAHTDTIRMSGVTWGKTNKNCIAFFDENFMPMGCYIGNGYVEAAPTSVTGKAKKVSCLGDRSLHSVTVKDGVSTFTITFLDADKETTSIINYSGEHVKYFRIGAEGSGANMVVTVNEEIAGSQQEGEYAWCNTGHAFVPADYEDRILELEEKVEALSDRNDMGADVAGQLYTFKGKKIMFFGDSITRNEASYIQNLLDRTGMIRVANFAIDGAKLRNKGDTQMDGNPSFELNNTVPNQVQKLLNNISSYDVPDIIIVSAGTNDDSAESGYDEGKYTDDTGAYIELDAISLTNFSGAMRWIYEKLISCYPNARIFFATPIQASYGSRTYATTKTKAECIKQNCERLSTPYIDAFSKSGIYSRYETQSANGKYLKDGLHPNSDGAVVLAKCYHRELANALI